MRKNIGLILFLFCFADLRSQKTLTHIKPAIRVTAYSPVMPVLKESPVNAVLRIRIYVPAGHSPLQARNIQFSLNPAAIASVEKVELFDNGSEPYWMAGEAIATSKPNAGTFTLPANLLIKPGLRYLWIGITLRNDAKMDIAVKLLASRLVDITNKSYPVVEEKAITQQFTGLALRKAWDDSVHTYRIPGIVTTAKGNLVAVYDIRYKNDRDLPGDIDVGMSRSTDGGHTWEPMKTIIDMGAPHENNGVGDPAILFDPATNTIWVAALWSKGNRSIAGSKPGLSPDTTGQLVLVKSTDEGLSWSAPISITPQVKDPAWHLYFNGPGNGIAMHNGVLVFPTQYWDEKRIPFSAIIYSKDQGQTWQSGRGAKSETTESQLVETVPGTLMLNMRNNRGGFRAIATTDNLGHSWTEHPTSFSALPDPVCMGSLIKARVKVKGQLKEVLFFSNPATESGRFNITIKASLDLGESWLPVNQLLLDERRCYGYSALTKIDDTTIGILYEGNRELYFVRIPVASVIK